METWRLLTIFQMISITGWSIFISSFTALEVTSSSIPTATTTTNNGKGNDDHPHPQMLSVNVTPLLSLFRVNQGPPEEREGRRMIGGGGGGYNVESREEDGGGSGGNFGDGGMVVECVCSVVVNGGHNLRGEEAICGRNRRRILCPQHGGCQTAMANVQGIMSTVKTCGYEAEGIGCRVQRQKAQFVGDVEVQRCFCMGRLCNDATKQVTTPPSTHLMTILSTTFMSFFLYIFWLG